MKKIKLFIVLAVFLFATSCKKNKKQEKDVEVKITGEIVNPTSEKVAVIDADNKTVLELSLDKDKKFEGTSTLKEGFYAFSHGPETTKMYLKPGFNLNIFLDAKQFDESVNYKGDGAGINNYLAKSFLNNENAKSAFDYARLDEKSFLKSIDSLTDVKMNFLTTSQKIEDSFKNLEKASIELERLKQLVNYEMYRPMVLRDKNFKVSDSFPHPYKEENIKAYLDRSDLLVLPSFTELISRYVFYKEMDQYKKKTVKPDFPLFFLNSIIKNVANKEIKSQLIYEDLQRSLIETKKLEEVFALAKKNLNEEHLEGISKLYGKVLKIQKGSKSPSFDLIDIEGKNVSLESLKGSVLYIDIWATWCGPCMRQMPFLEKLQEDYKDKNIKFVSICKSDKKENWEKFVKERKLRGVKLFAANESTSFFSDYLVTGIPRFILLDKNGNIIHSSAERPSSPGVREMLDNALR